MLRPLFVTAGFILGFDSEGASVADAMVELIEKAAIPVCMIGLLYALPNTQLTRRLAQEGRLHEFVEGTHRGSADQCSQGLDFDTLRPRREMLLDYIRVLKRIYDPNAYIGRVRRLTQLLDNSQRKQETQSGDVRNRFSSAQMLHRLIAALPEPRASFWQAITECVSANPKSARHIVTHMAFYFHLGPFSRYVIRQIEQKIEEIDAGIFNFQKVASPPARLQTAVM
jgi:hypothetical protein